MLAIILCSELEGEGKDTITRAVEQAIRRLRLPGGAETNEPFVDLVRQTSIDMLSSSKATFAQQDGASSFLVKSNQSTLFVPTWPSISDRGMQSDPNLISTGRDLLDCQSRWMRHEKNGMMVFTLVALAVVAHLVGGGEKGDQFHAANLICGTDATEIYVQPSPGLWKKAVKPVVELGLERDSCYTLIASQGAKGYSCFKEAAAKQGLSPF